MQLNSQISKLYSTVDSMLLSSGRMDTLPCILLFLLQTICSSSYLLTISTNWFLTHLSNLSSHTSVAFGIIFFRYSWENLTPYFVVRTIVSVFLIFVFLYFSNFKATKCQRGLIWLKFMHWATSSPQCELMLVLGIVARFKQHLQKPEGVLLSWFWSHCGQSNTTRCENLSL